MGRRLSPFQHAAESLVETVRLGLSRATLSVFAHAPYPLEHTLDHGGDPGLLGPDSISWRVIADPAAIVGGLRGLLVQAAHPEVVAGVAQHSRYRDDPMGRLSRTSAYITATTFGAVPEVEHAVDQVRRIHRVVRGTSTRGRPYDAADPGLSAWVHNALTDSFLEVNQAYAGKRLSTDEADRFVLEQTKIGALLGSDPIPETADELSSWVTGHPAIERSPEMVEAMNFLSDPPLSPGIKVGYMILLEAAAATIPEGLRRVLGLKSRPGGLAVGKTAARGMRWALGYSPSWALALQRTGSEIDWEMFKHIPDGALDRAS